MSEKHKIKKMTRFHVACECGWSAEGETHNELLDAYNAHRASAKETGK